MLTDKQQKKIDEQRMGMKITMRNMCNGIIDLLRSEMDTTKKFSFELVENGQPDFRFWDVKVTIRSSGEPVYTEPFGKFPSNELRTVLLLMGA